MVPGADRQVDGPFYEMLNPFVKIDQLAGHPLLILQVEKVAPNGYKIIFRRDFPEPVKPRNMKMKIGGQKKFHCCFRGIKAGRRQKQRFWNDLQATSNPKLMRTPGAP